MISKYAFYLALFVELTIVILEKSEYIIQYEGLWFRLTFVLFGLGLITTKRSLKQWIWLVMFGIVGVLSYKTTGRNEILRWIVFIWACQEKDMKKVLKYTFWYTTAGCLVIYPNIFPILLNPLFILRPILFTFIFTFVSFNCASLIYGIIRYSYSF